MISRILLPVFLKILWGDALFEIQAPDFRQGCSRWLHKRRTCQSLWVGLHYDAKIFIIKILFFPKWKKGGIIALSRTHLQQKKMDKTIKTYAELSRLKRKRRWRAAKASGDQEGYKSWRSSRGACSEFVAGGQEKSAQS